MRSALRVVPGVVVALAVAGCGEEDGAETQARERAPAPRCTPARSRTVEPRAKWEVGDRRELAIERSRTELGGAGESRASASGTLEVVGKTAGAWRLRWKPEGFGIKPAAGPLDRELPEQLKDLFEGLVVEYSTDRSGALVEVENVEEIRERFERLLAEAERATAGDASAGQGIAAVRRVVSSDAFIEGRVLEDVALLHEVYGVEFTERRPLRFESQLPNPLGGGPLPARLAAVLEDARDPAGCALFETTLVPEPGPFRAAVERFLAESGQPSGPSELRGFELRHVTRASYDPGSGWVVKAVATKKVDVAGGGLVERTVVTSR
jgi:hypothetical protein